MRGSQPARGHTRGVPDPAPDQPRAPGQAAPTVDAVIRGRRTSLLQDPAAPVPDDLLARLVEAATWAPNHKRTWPWRFTILRDDARARFGDALADAAASLGLGPAQEAKLRTKYLRSAVVALVWVVPGEGAVRAREDRDATAAAVQNLLLAATAHGLGSYWGSVPDALVPAARAVAQVGNDHDLVALVYLGWPTGTVPAPTRPPAEVTWLS